MKKLLILIMAALPMLAMAQTNVKVDSVGKLSSQLGDQKYKIADLKISGALNGNDIGYCHPYKGRQEESRRVSCHIHRPLWRDDRREQ